MRPISFSDSIQSYFVTSDIIVPEGMTLIIEPGVNLLFSPNTGIHVYGSLIAVGDANKYISF